MKKILSSILVIVMFFGFVSTVGASGYKSLEESSEMYAEFREDLESLISFRNGEAYYDSEKLEQLVIELDLESLNYHFGEDWTTETFLESVKNNIEEMDEPKPQLRSTCNVTRVDTTLLGKITYASHSNTIKVVDSYRTSANRALYGKQAVDYIVGVVGPYFPVRAAIVQVISQIGGLAISDRLNLASTISRNNVTGCGTRHFIDSQYPTWWWVEAQGIR